MSYTINSIVHHRRRGLPFLPGNTDGLPFYCHFCQIYKRWPFWEVSGHYNSFWIQWSKKFYQNFYLEQNKLKYYWSVFLHQKVWSCLRRSFLKWWSKIRCFVKKNKILTDFGKSNILEKMRNFNNPVFLGAKFGPLKSEIMTILATSEIIFVPQPQNWDFKAKLTNYLSQNRHFLKIVFEQWRK